MGTSSGELCKPGPFWGINPVPAGAGRWVVDHHELRSYRDAMKPCRVCEVSAIG